MAPKKSTISFALMVASLVCAVAILAISIAVVVKVYKNDDETTTTATKQSETSTATMLIPTTTTTTATAAPTVAHYTAATIAPSDPKYEGFQNALTRLKTIMNLSADPCEDFYSFTCGNYNGLLSFDDRQNADYDVMLTKLKDSSYVTPTLPKPVVEMIKYYNACMEANLDDQRNISYVELRMKDLDSLTSISFPLLSGVDPQPLTPKQLGNAIGYLWGTLRISTFLTPSVDTHWKVPKRGYLLLFDQSTLTYGNNYYTNDVAWNLIKDDYRKKIEDVCKVIKPDIAAETLKADIDAIFDLEKKIATDLSVNETMLRLYARQFNKYTRSLATSEFQFIDWKSMFDRILMYADENVKKKVTADNFEFIIQEGDVLRKLGELIVNGTAPFTPRNIANYFYIRLLLANSDFLLPSTSSFRDIGMSVPRVGRPRVLRRPPSPRRLHVENKDYYCADATMNNLQYANARLFVDALKMKQEDLSILRKTIAQYTESILVAFRGMLDQLEWMDDLTKLGAYDKINYLVTNMAYPDFINNNTALEEYYTDLEAFNSDDNYALMNEKIFKWSTRNYLSRLIWTEYKRDEFDLPPGFVNAWYQPELNSITLPLATLGPPFFDLNWPVSLNYGSLGVIIGHELTHGFDDEGVQWNGVGALDQWMQDKSYTSFKKMAQCIIDEYSSFTIPGMPNINGELTQGENIADNGGIHAAYRAYKNYVNLLGEDLLLNDPLFSQLSQDQLFFVGFAQVWCESNATKYGTLEHDLTNPHSPSFYRVLGTIQNFPAFKNAFNCPANKAYTPEQHCDVWVSNVTSAYGFPLPQPVRKTLNVPPPEQISPTRPEYRSYQKAVQYFQESMDSTQDPCNNFYEYACGNYKQERSFSVMRENNYKIMANQMETATYNTPEALSQTVLFYKRCEKVRQNYAQAIKDGATIRKIMDEFTNASGLSFSMVTGTTEPTESLTPEKLGYAIGLLSRRGVHTLVSPMVDTNWPEPSNFKFFLDQNTLYYSKSYYAPDAWKTIYDSYMQSTINLFNNYAHLLGITLNQNNLTRDIDQLFNFELMLADANYTTDDATRRNYTRSVNFYSNDTFITFIDLSSYFTALSGDFSELASYFKNLNGDFIVMEPDTIRKLNDNFNTFDPNTVTNYLFYRLLAAYSGYLPRYQPTNIVFKQHDLGRPRRIGIYESLQPVDVAYADSKTQCAYETLSYMQYANARIYIDSLYPEETDRQRVRNGTAELVESILESFSGMLDRLPWVDKVTRDGADFKITNLIKNYAFPDFIMDNTTLQEYYNDMDLAENDTYFDMREKLENFNFKLSYKVLLNNTPVDRFDFNSQPGTVNAWYIPEYNSITFPAGILMMPFFDLNWPASLNYGGLGVVIGHELSHGFDDQGIQWTGDGTLKDWMQQDAQNSFNQMAKCVIDEYSGFKPLNGTGYLPDNVNGANTQGENIADNGGIHAAWNSYKDYVALHGPDPQLPDDVIGQITHDQLFFLNFAQVWCQRPPEPLTLYTQIMTDPHSPSKERVLGTIQNFPAFRTAYNCPVDTVYAPSKHCSVWVPEVKN